jgi:hypothetical protein
VGAQEPNQGVALAGPDHAPGRTINSAGKQRVGGACVPRPAGRSGNSRGTAAPTSVDTDKHEQQQSTPGPQWT